MQIQTLSYESPQPTKGRKHRRRCSVCDGPTKDSKPWCVEHITQSPYAKWIVSKMKYFDAEVDLVKHTRNIKSIKENGLLIQEVVRTLHYRGSKTIRGLAKDISISPDVIEVCARYLIAKGLAEMRQTKKRDDFFIDLIVVPSFFAPSYGKE